MTRYRDRETGEAVEAYAMDGHLEYRVKRNGKYETWAAEFFRARFEPVEGGDAEPRPRP